MSIKCGYSYKSDQLFVVYITFSVEAFVVLVYQKRHVFLSMSILLPISLPHAFHWNDNS